jgi:hypothetical protein
MFKFFKNKKTEKKTPDTEPSSVSNPIEETTKNQPLVENKDFYIENGSYVFTAYYLKKRGYCCENRCRHCPYGIHET